MPILMVMMLLPMVIPERKRRQITMVLSKTLYGALEHNLLMPGAALCAAMAMITVPIMTRIILRSPLLDTRKLYSQSWDAAAL